MGASVVLHSVGTAAGILHCSGNLILTIKFFTLARETKIENTSFVFTNIFGFFKVRRLLEYPLVLQHCIVVPKLLGSRDRLYGRKFFQDF